MILFDPDQAEAVEGFPRLAVSSGMAAAAGSSGAALPKKPTLSRYLREAQAVVGLRGEVSVLLTTDDGIRGLNKRFRKKNKATDVLSFPVDDVSFGSAGDLAISVEKAARQAAEQGHKLSVELRVLMLHGLLHLAGLDHETDDGAMARKERRLRTKLGLPLGLIERNREQGIGARESRSRFPEGMTERKARAKAKAKAKAKASAKANASAKAKAKAGAKAKAKAGAKAKAKARANTKTKAEAKVEIRARKAAAAKTRQGLAR